MNKSYTYLVVGAGPAGLAFASSVDTTKFLVVDLGKPIHKRSRHHPEECVQGAGGAGLFSDGKFSFYPAGTELWKLDAKRLKQAYIALERDLSPYGAIPSFPEISHEDKFQQDKAGWFFKPYPSLYLSLEDRYRLIETMANKCPTVLYETEFVDYCNVDGGYSVTLKNRATGDLFHVHTEQLVLAGGRFMPLFLNRTMHFRRYEFGFRIVGPAQKIIKEIACLDPKYVFKQPGVEYRTFCWCERGEVVQTKFQGIQSYSGRADCAPTGISNFGFNIRVKDTSLLSESDFRKMIRISPFETRLDLFMDTLHHYYPQSAASLIEYGLRKLLERFIGLADKSISVVGPTIEGVGLYPVVEENFSLAGAQGISVIGDCSGMYRGIIPCMLSGYSLANIYNKKKEELL